MHNPAPLAQAAAIYLAIPDPSATLLVSLRWIHFVAGIMWVGLLYFFNLVSTPTFLELDANTRAKVFPGLMSRAFFWFRWASVVTVFVGIWYWMKIVGTDARNADSSPGTAIWSFFVIWTVAFVIYMGVLMAPAATLHKGPVLALITAILIFAASYAYIRLNTHGWESNRLLCIGIGGGLGWFMMFNVWGLIWRMQKRMIIWTRDNAEKGTALPNKAANFSRITFLAARTNFWLSFPMLFFMAAASHYPIFLS